MPKLSLRRRLPTLTLVVGLSLTAACGHSAGDSGSGPIKVGTSLPLTGEFSQSGKAAEQGYRVWAKMVNDQGGLLGRQVELVVKDDASNQNTIVADYNALISQDKADLLAGSYSSLLNLPASAVAERNRMLFVEPAGGSPKMFNRGFKYLFFSQQAVSDRQGALFADWLAKLPADRRPKTAAYPTLDDPFAAPLVDNMRKTLEAADIQTVYQQTYAVDTKNFDTIASAMKAKAPDLVVHGALFEDGVGLVNAMLKADLKPKWLFQTTAPSLGKQYADAIGAKNTEGITFAISHAPQAKTPGNAEFVAAYEKMYGGEPPEDAGDAYAAGQIMAAAVKGVGSLGDQGKLADWLRANPVDTVLGNLRWNADGSPVGQYLIGQWQSGKVEFVLPEDVATAQKIIEGWKPGVGG
ncbi:amino acid ABC transporter substrate-binding protein [Amycolatopsis sp. WQ 127309]|uniref:amino acid ABC transporter substrate-binding protein n=1 Tax=Amycolatopsis sp. WQ 127309 TaxID=2932773 RepID=UPI001FF2DFC8|nr:amino acid ABC transporter substrate-binding protein [Amycolatopsis sp. WQ 127309]UOZ03444.1 amino acid ABC transporter substrate-binding protein [Amycolatopsis sp. WQ 127309]